MHDQSCGKIFQSLPCNEYSAKMIFANEIKKFDLVVRRKVMFILQNFIAYDVL